MSGELVSSERFCVLASFPDRSPPSCGSPLTAYCLLIPVYWLALVFGF